MQQSQFDSLHQHATNLLKLQLLLRKCPVKCSGYRIFAGHSAGCPVYICFFSCLLWNGGAHNELLTRPAWEPMVAEAHSDATECVLWRVRAKLILVWMCFACFEDAAAAFDAYLIFVGSDQNHKPNMSHNWSWAWRVTLLDHASPALYYRFFLRLGIRYSSVKLSNLCPSQNVLN